LDEALGARKMIKEPISIMLDTTIYKQIPKLNTVLFGRLIKYARIGLIKIYISEIIEKEYLTWIQKETQEAYNNVVKTTEALSRFYEEPDIFGIKMHFNLTASMAHTQINEVLKNVIDNWNEYKKDTNAIVLPINDLDGKNVMDAYFKGNAPFRESKCRIDIPDAFIYFSITGILKEVNSIVFITQDKELAKRIRSKEIITFESLTDFFSCKEYCIPQDYFKELQPNDKVHFLFQYFKKEILKIIKRKIEFSDNFPNIEQELIDKVIGEFDEISLSAENIILNLDTAKRISELEYLIPFTADLVHSISSKANKQELEYEGEERIKKLKDKNVNDNGLFEITEEKQTQVLGNLSISFQDSDPLSWEEKTITKTTFFPTLELEEVSIYIEDIGEKT